MHEVPRYCGSAYTFKTLNILIRRANHHFTTQQQRKLVFMRLVGQFCICHDIIEYLIFAPTEGESILPFQSTS